MNILIIGSGGREHALGWKIKQSPLVSKIYFAPGNPGTKKIGENIAIEPTDIKGLLSFAKSKKIDLTVVGPETPLVMGITDVFKKEKLKIFGPSKKASQMVAYPDLDFGRDCSGCHRQGDPSLIKNRNNFALLANIDCLRFLAISD